MGNVQIFHHKNNLELLLHSAGMENLVGRGDNVALKVHMGEKKCKTYLTPKTVKEVVDFVKDLGAKPFVVDSPTLYTFNRYTASGYRNIAKSHGFTESYLGAKVIIGGGEDGEKSVETEIEKYFELNRIEVIPEIASADSMIVLTHVTGHISIGYAGILKQLGMGCVNKQMKRAVHEPTLPRLFIEDCQACGTCISFCPFNQIEVEEKISIGNDCSGCGRCIGNCPNDVIHRKENFIQRFYMRLMDASKGVVNLFEDSGKPRIIYLNFLKKIYEFCDCSSYSGKKLMPDVGILAASGYPLAIEKATVDLVRKKKSDLFPEVESYIKIGRKISLGDITYTFVRK
ncbi:MAG: DUF362 domain-containing protein [Candidatus Bathyarchaeota archaeon]